MKSNDDNQRRDSRLREAAEGRLERQEANAAPAHASAELAPALPHELVHDLEVHQIELEMQNEALRQATIALEESRDRYLDLYEFAPLGYLTLASDGLVAEINLTGSALFGIERKKLLHRCFSAFVAADDQSRWVSYFRAVRCGDRPGPLALTLLRGDGALWHAQIDCTMVNALPRGGAAAESADGVALGHGVASGLGSSLRIALTDISERKLAEASLQESEAQLRQFSRHLQQVREEDRAHFARELHDDLGQSLSALRIDFDLLASALAADQPALVSRLAAIDQVILGTVDAVRRICEDLRPGMLDDLGLAAALSSHVKRFAAQSAIACDLALEGDDYELDEPRSTAIFRLVQEALTNVARHAHASHVMVALQRGDHDDLLLTIADDGCGMPAESSWTLAADASGQRYGLLGMRERVTMLGGRMSIDSAPGRGTHIEVSIPRSAGSLA